MKKLLLAVTFLTFLTISSWSNASESTPLIPVSKAHQTKQSNVLFVMVAKEGDIRATSQEGSYKLTLKNLNPSTIYFTNRPTRISGHLATKKLIQQWKIGTFKQTPPNAILVVVPFNEETDELAKIENTYPVVLTNPNYSPFQKNKITFNIESLPGAVNKLPAVLHSDYVAIFLDDVCLSCIG